MDVLSATKTAVSRSYTPGENVTYVLSIVNSGEAAVTGLTVTDDLGGFTLGDQTVYPLAYEDGSLLYLADGTPQPAPAVTAGPPLVIQGIDVPGNGNVTLIYEARVTGYAPLGAGAVITNTAAVEGGCAPLTASATIPMADEAELTISKAVSPAVVEGCGELTYTFVIQNTGSEAAGAEAMVSVADTFDPVLTDLTVSLDGASLARTIDYTYDETTGHFVTVPGQITVPGASYTQNADGTWTTTPGVTVLTVAGTL